MAYMASIYPNYFPSGRGWKYSNTNYILAGMIIEAVTNESTSNIINSYLHGNQTLHLSNTFYLPNVYSPEEMARMAHGYDMEGVDVTGNSMSWAYTAGALVSTTEDLLAWWKSLFENHILSTQQLTQMMSLVCEHTTKNHSCVAGRPASHLEAWQSETRYGLGIIQSATGSSAIGTTWWHNGSTQGYKAIVMWFPKNNIYMSLMIDRDPGYLLTPRLPIVRNTLHALLPNSSIPTCALTYTHKTTKHRNHIRHTQHHRHHRSKKHKSHKN